MTLLSVLFLIHISCTQNRNIKWNLKGLFTVYILCIRSKMNKISFFLKIYHFQLRFSIEKRRYRSCGLIRSRAKRFCCQSDMQQTVLLNFIQKSTLYPQNELRKLLINSKLKLLLILFNWMRHGFIRIRCKALNLLYS